MAASDYVAGNGEDKVFVVLREDRPPEYCRNRANAIIMAREITNEGGLVTVFNTLTQKFELISDYVDIAQNDKDAIAAGKAELSGLRSKIVHSRQKLAGYKEQEAALRVAAE